MPIGLIIRLVQVAFLSSLPVFLGSILGNLSVSFLFERVWPDSDSGRAATHDLSLNRQQIGHYTSTGDPINLVFVGSPRAVLKHFDHHLRWNKAWQWSADYTSFYMHGQWCLDDRPQRFSSLLPITRYHIRFKIAVTGPDCTSAGAQYVLAAVHRDHIAGCPYPKHVSSDFNTARDAIVRAFIHGGHTVQWENVGNTSVSIWCDGSQVQGDGWVAIIHIETPILEDGKLYQAALSRVGEEDTYSFAGVAGQVAVMEMHALAPLENSLEPFLVLRGPDGNILGHSGDAAGNGEASIVITFPYTGRYQITAASVEGRTTGWYALSVHTSISTTAKV